MRVRGKRSGVVMNLPGSLAQGLLREGSVELVTRAPAAAPELEPEKKPVEPEPDALTCPDCGATAKTPAGLAAHKRAKH